MAHLCGLVRWLLLIAVFNFVTSGSVDDVLGDQQVEGQKERPEHLFARSPSLASEEEADQDDQDGGTRDISDDMLRYLFDRTASELQARRAINHEEQRYNELMRPQPAVIGGQLVRQLPLDYDEEPENDEVAGDAMPGSIVYGDNGQGRLEIPDELYDYVMQANKGGRRVGAEPVPYMSSSNLREQATDDEIAEGLLDYLFEKTDDSDDEKMLLEPPEQQLDSHPSKYFTEQLTQNADLPEISDELLEYLLRKTMDEPEISDGQDKLALESKLERPSKISLDGLTIKRNNGEETEPLAGKPAVERPIKLTKYNKLVQAANGQDSQYQAAHLEVVSSKVDAHESSQRMAYLTVGLVALVVSGVAATLALFLINRDRGFKEKVKSLFSNYVDTEASKDYQDLCRQRMQRKDIEKVDPVTPKTGPVSPPAGGPGQGKRSSPLSNQSSDDNGRPVLSSRSSTSSWSEEPVTVNMDISTGHMILTYMEDFLKNKNKLDKEWESLVDYEADPCATTVAKMAANVKKNRNVDLVPYDHSRVVLNDLSNVTGSDYINASTITDHDPRNPAYIASQGPLADTAADFWQMIWEQGTVTIVMLTRLMETGLPVCARYWPEEGSEVYHNYEVHLVSEHIWCTDFLVRSFYLKNLRTNETRTVTQFHYLSWTENGLPPSAKTLLDFRRKVNKSFRGKSCPIAVHCSDGVGRTGTYCLIDMVLNRMANGAKEIDIAATLEHIRDQRMGLVRTKAQFEFVLKAVAEEVTAILKALQGGPAH